MATKKLISLLLLFLSTRLIQADMMHNIISSFRNTMCTLHAGPYTEDLIITQKRSLTGTWTQPEIRST